MLTLVSFIYGLVLGVGIVNNNRLISLVFQEVDNIKEEFEANFNDEEIDKIGKNTVPQEKYDELKVNKWQINQFQLFELFQSHAF